MKDTMVQPIIPKKTPYMVRVATLVIGLMVAIVLASGSIILYWAFQPSGSNTILAINNDPTPISPLEVGDGSMVIARLDFCKIKKAPGKVEVFLIGETGGAKIAINWPDDELGKICSKDSPGRVKCLDTDKGETCLPILIPIPGQTPTDTYHTVFTIRYRVNPLKESETVFRTRSFKVINVNVSKDSAKPQ